MTRRDPMRVLHVIAGDLDGGAARGAMWLIDALRRRGTACDVLNNRPKSGRVNGVTAPVRIADRVRSRCREHFEVLQKLSHFRRRRTSFSSGMAGLDLTTHPLYDSADIVHLHWINQGFVRVSALTRIRKPLVWTLRDMWSATGGCHYPFDCEKFTTGCGACPQLGSTRESDLSSRIHHNKLVNLPAHLVGVGISTWITEQAGRSPIMRTKELRTIPNGIPLDSFYPVDRTLARQMLGIPLGIKIVLTGAQRLDSRYKGLSLFLRTVDLLDDDVTVMLFGDRAPLFNSRRKTLRLGYVEDIETLRAVYSAADAFVATSVQEAFGKTLVEAMACGTPVVAFNATGPRDIVDHRENGYLARAYAADDLAHGIHWVLADQGRRSDLSRNALAKARSTFDIHQVARQYSDLYGELAQRSKLPEGD